MNPRLTRQELLRRGAAGSALLAFPSLLAACGGGGGGGGAEGELKDVLNFSNWELYIDNQWAKQQKIPSTFQTFTKKTGIKVNYYEDVNSNSEYFAKVQGRLSRDQGIDRDIFVSTDNDKFVGEYIDNGWVQKLDKSLIPNISNLIPAQQHPPFDPDREYSLPWLSGMDGIAWNEDLTDPVTTVDKLLTDPNLKGKVTVWNSMGDTLGLVLLQNGDDPAKVTDASFDRAVATVQKAVDAGQIRKFTGNEYAALLANGSLAACMAWSGDVAQLLVDNPKLHWTIPETGGIIWTDNMFIPLGGSVPTASTYMNFVYDPEIAAQIAVGTSYISAVAGVKPYAVKLDPESAANPLIFPDDKTLSQVHQNDPAMLSNPDYNKKWLAVQGQ